MKTLVRLSFAQGFEARSAPFSPPLVAPRNGSASDETGPPVQADTSDLSRLPRWHGRYAPDIQSPASGFGASESPSLRDCPNAIQDGPSWEDLVRPLRDCRVAQTIPLSERLKPLQEHDAREGVKVEPDLEPPKGQALSSRMAEPLAALHSWTGLPGMAKVASFRIILLHRQVIQPTEVAVVFAHVSSELFWPHRLPQCI